MRKVSRGEISAVEAAGLLESLSKKGAPRRTLTENDVDAPQQHERSRGSPSARGRGGGGGGGGGRTPTGRGKGGGRSPRPVSRYSGHSDELKTAAARERLEASDSDDDKSEAAAVRFWPI